ncbi:hypothetical protein Q0590_35710 [Rhodocytophaga aerolata]|uniref:VWA domain-containing protein n=1 Tax=Rhodocytophaga aerolata TaxID=455078 RepID=A0ABT8RKN0_9BACT|nr:hypothetical protein [Rhodocytophaga aerolata]MDO1451675.1 hypothetical protein [Rhodocytophaga aerolata]
MINSLLKEFVDFTYGVGRAKRNYLIANPNEIILAADGSKSIMTNGSQTITKGIDWVTSQRAVVILTDKRIKSGKWDIPLEKVEQAQLLKIGSLFGSGQVLKIQTKDNEYYQFGMQLNPDWTNQQSLPLTLEKGEVKYSFFSIVVRVVAVAYLIYWLIERIK